MEELSSPGGVSDTTAGSPGVRRCRSMMCRALLALLVTLVSLPSLYAQSGSPVRQPSPPRGIYTPKPVYRPEWAKQGLKGKGVVLVTIDKQTGKVTGARMLTSTGNPQLDGAALQAYSQWRFDPRTVAVPQLQIPIEFATLPPPQPPKRTVPQPVIVLIVLVA